MNPQAFEEDALEQLRRLDLDERQNAGHHVTAALRSLMLASIPSKIPDYARAWIAEEICRSPIDCGIMDIPTVRDGVYPRLVRDGRRVETNLLSIHTGLAMWFYSHEDVEKLADMLPDRDSRWMTDLSQIEFHPSEKKYRRVATLWWTDVLPPFNKDRLMDYAVRMLSSKQFIPVFQDRIENIPNM